MNSSAVIATMLLILVLSTTGVSYYYGRQDGRAAEQADQLEMVRRLNQSLAEKQKQLDEAERNRLAEVIRLQLTINQLEEEADADPNAHRPSVSIDGVRRLNRIR